MREIPQQSVTTRLVRYLVSIGSAAIAMLLLLAVVSIKLAETDERFSAGTLDFLIDYTGSTPLGLSFYFETASSILGLAALGSLFVAGALFLMGRKSA